MRRPDLSIPRFVDLMILVLLAASSALVAAELPAVYRGAQAVLEIGSSGHALLGLSIGLYLFAHVIRVVRLHTIIGIGRVRFATLLGFHSVWALTTFFTPFKLGDIVRAVEIFRLLKDDMRGPFAVWVDRLLDAAMLVVVLTGLSFVGLPLASTSFGIVITAAVFALCASAFVVLFVPGAIASLARALLPSSSRRSLLLLTACAHLAQLGRQFPRLDFPTLSLLVVLTLAIWVCELGAVVLVLAALSPSLAILPESAAEVYARILIASPAQLQAHVAVYYGLALLSLGLLVIVTAGHYFRLRITIVRQSRGAPLYRATSPFRGHRLEIRGRTR